MVLDGAWIDQNSCHGYGVMRWREAKGKRGEGGQESVYRVQVHSNTHIQLYINTHQRACRESRPRSCLKGAQLLCFHKFPCAQCAAVLRTKTCLQLCACSSRGGPDQTEHHATRSYVSLEAAHDNINMSSDIVHYPGCCII